MEKFFDNAAAIIKAAAGNTLGPIALIILILAILSWQFFGRESVWIRMLIFGLMFAFGLTLVILAGYISKPELIPDKNSSTPKQPTLEQPNGNPPVSESPPITSSTPEPSEASIDNLVKWGEFKDYFEISEVEKGERPETTSKPPRDVLNFTMTARGNLEFPGFRVVYYGPNGNELSYSDLPDYARSGYSAIRVLSNSSSWKKGESSRAYLEMPPDISKLSLKKTNTGF